MKQHREINDVNACMLSTVYVIECLKYGISIDIMLRTILGYPIQCSTRPEVRDMRKCEFSSMTSAVEKDRNCVSVRAVGRTIPPILDMNGFLNKVCIGVTRPKSAVKTCTLPTSYLFQNTKPVEQCKIKQN